MFFGTVRSDDDGAPGVALVFLSLLLLGQLGEVTSIHLDATFRRIPLLFHQLLTIHIIKHNRVSKRRSCSLKLIKHIYITSSVYVRQNLI